METLTNQKENCIVPENGKWREVNIFNTWELKQKGDEHLEVLGSYRQNTGIYSREGVEGGDIRQSTHVEPLSISPLAMSVVENILAITVAGTSPRCCERQIVK